MKCVRRENFEGWNDEASLDAIKRCIYVKNVNQKYKYQFVGFLSYPRLGLRSPNVERNKNAKVNLRETTVTDNGDDYATNQ